MTRTLIIAVVLALALSVPVFAQGAFNDVPTDHWAYEAVNQLQRDGIVIGYPDGTFGGKRAMSRYEFAVAIARLNLDGDDDSGLVRRSELGDYVKKSDLPDLADIASKSDVDMIKKLVDEFEDELAALGVDVDALKRDVKALETRVAALEEEVERFKWHGVVNTFAIGRHASEGTVVDIDGRFATESTIGGAAAYGKGKDLLETVDIVVDVDLLFDGKISDNITAHGALNIGNYIGDDTDPNSWGYMRGALDVAQPQPTTPAGGNFQGLSITDDFNLYMAYVDIETGNNDHLWVGRFPIQFTPYTLMLIDQDSYTDNWKTDNGDYMVDGATYIDDMGAVDLQVYGAKHDSTRFYANGLSFAGPAWGLGLPGGASLGGLTTNITHSAGGRVTADLGWNEAMVGGTYYEAWSKSGSYQVGTNYTRVRVWGADAEVPFATNWAIGGSWTRSDTLAATSAVPDIDSNNNAYDVWLSAEYGGFTGMGGYKHIQPNFAAAGNWGAIGRVLNMTNIKGWYADLGYEFNDQFALGGSYEDYDIISNTGEATTYDVNACWKWDERNSVEADYYNVDWGSSTAGTSKSTEKYLTIGWKHMLGENANVKLSYQFIDWNPGTGTNVYGENKYRGGIGVVQFGFSF